MSVMPTILAVTTGVVVIVVAIAVVLVVLIVTVSMRGRQKRSAQRRAETHGRADVAQERTREDDPGPDG